MQMAPREAALTILLLSRLQTMTADDESALAVAVATVQSSVRVSTHSAFVAESLADSRAAPLATQALALLAFIAHGANCFCSCL